MKLESKENRRQNRTIAKSFPASRSGFTLIELLVVVGGELLDTAACLIEDVEAGL